MPSLATPKKNSLDNFHQALGTRLRHMNSEHRSSTPNDMLTIKTEPDSPSPPLTCSDSLKGFDPVPLRSLIAPSPFERVRQPWDQQFQSEIAQRKHQFLQQWQGQQIPAEAVDEFVHNEEIVNTSYSAWDQDQLQQYEHYLKASSQCAAKSLTMTDGKSMRSLDFNAVLAQTEPSNGIPALSQQELTSIVDILLLKVARLEKDNNAIHDDIKRLQYQSLATQAVDDDVQDFRTKLKNLYADVAELKETVTRDVLKTGDKLVTEKAFENEMQLMKLTFGGKCTLIEKILGVDITTTGPKPGNLLELLHKRLWYLESTLLPAGNPWCHGHMPYRSLTDYVRPNLSAANRTTNYATVPKNNASHIPFSANNGGICHSADNISHAMNGNGHPSHPAFSTNFGPPFHQQMHLDPHDVRYRHPEGPKSNNQHPLQHDPSIPKGPKPRSPNNIPRSKPCTPEYGSLPISPSPDWPSLSEAHNSPQKRTSNRKNGAKLKMETNTEQKSLFLQHSMGAFRSNENIKMTEIKEYYEPSSEHPIPQTRRNLLFQAFMQGPGDFNDHAKTVDHGHLGGGSGGGEVKLVGLCGEEGCDFC